MTSSGSNIEVGDILGSGTISGSEQGSYGSMLELSSNGLLHIKDGLERKFIEDGDTITFTGKAEGFDFTIGFGECKGLIQPSLNDL